jgi:hypothetical protein
MSIASRLPAQVLLALLMAAPAALAAADGLSLRIGFQPAQTPAEPGWLADHGDAFAAHGDQAYGWNGDNHTAYQRSQPTSPDLAHDTVIHLQRPENPDARWRLALPNGIYQVRLVCGDPTYANSVFKVAVQDVVVVDGTPGPDRHWIEGTAVVQVSDGMLVVSNASGASNNKLCSIEVTSVASNG